MYTRSFKTSDSTLYSLVAELEANASPATVTDDSTFVLLSIP
jgi:hypothetical protein